jgi:putative transposase
MIDAKVETSEKKVEIEAALKDAKNISWYRRLKVIQLSSQGKSVPELAQLFDVCSSVVRHYIHLYNKGGLEKLAPALIPGRPRLLSQFDGEWEELQWKSPSQYEKLQTQGRRWTLQLLVSYVDLYYDIETTTVTVSAALKRNGLRLGRSKLRVTSPDPDYTVKRQRVEELKKKASAGELTSDDVTILMPGIIPISPHKRARLYFFDETDLHWCPDTGDALHLPKKQVKVDSPGKDAVRFLLGSVQYPSGDGLYQLFSRKRNEEVQRHLEELLSMHPDDFLFVVLDNASSHTTSMLQPFLEANSDRLLLVFLPTYSPHLNLIERLWNFWHKHLTKNHFYDSLKALCEATVQWLQNLPFERFCSLMGIK